jgi:hypothetical protein
MRQVCLSLEFGRQLRLRSKARFNAQYARLLSGVDVPTPCMFVLERGSGATLPKCPAERPDPSDDMPSSAPFDMPY